MREKREKNATGLRFYPIYSVIKKYILTFFIFLTFSLRFFFCVSTRVLDTNMLVSKTRKNARKIKNASETTHSVIRPLYSY